MILSWLNINQELMIKLVANCLRMWAEAYPQDSCYPQGNPLLAWVRVEWEVLGDQWTSMVSCKSHTC